MEQRTNCRCKYLRGNKKGFMDALVLAGGQTPPELADGLEAGQVAPDRALIPLNGEPMLAYTLRALEDCSRVERIAVAGTPGVLAYLAEHYPQVLAVESGDSMVENAVRGWERLQEQSGASHVTLITTSDVPLVTGATYEEFLRGFEEKQVDASYAIVTRESCEAQFPGGKRTYANLQDGTYTAGNAVIVAGATVKKLQDIFEKFYRVRKNPLAIAKILGLRFVWRALRKQLTVKELETYLSKLLNARFNAVVMQDAAIAFDVDKIEDYHVAVTRLKQSKVTPGEN